MRFFRTKVKETLRHGLLAMVEDYHGAYVSGKRNRIERTVFFSMDGLVSMTDDFLEITEYDAMLELANWPEGQSAIKQLTRLHSA